MRIKKTSNYQDCKSYKFKLLFLNSIIYNQINVNADIIKIFYTIQQIMCYVVG